MTKRPVQPRILLLPAEAAERLGVSTRTLTRWADEGLIPVVVLPTGHRRYLTSDVTAVLEQGKASA
jgi:excisionase family DNA binding protein